MDLNIVYLKHMDKTYFLAFRYFFAKIPLKNNNFFIIQHFLYFYERRKKGYKKIENGF